MANTIVRHHDFGVVVRGRAVLLLLVIALATAAAINPDGPNDTFGRHNEFTDPGNEKVDLEEIYSQNMSPLDLSLKMKEVQYPEVDTTKIDLDLLNNVTARRVKAAKSILQFKFNTKRTKYLTQSKRVPDWTKGIVYWMYRDHRVQDNWAVLYAQGLAIINKVPLHVVFCRPKSIWRSTIRQYKYMIQGLKEVQSEFQRLNIQFHFLYGRGVEILPDFVKKHNLGAIVVDFIPLRDFDYQTKTLGRIFGVQLPVIVVDAHNIVPCWSASKRLALATSKFRFLLREGLKEFLTEFPPVIKHPFNSTELIPEPINWEETDKDFGIDRSVLPVPGVKAGYTDGMLELEHFMKYKLRNYSRDFRNPMIDGLSNLSPWLHFGQISPQRVVLEINRFSCRYYVDASSYREEVLTRRELADNYCYYNPSNYDKLTGARNWAFSTLKLHRNDTREYLYTREGLEDARTHDDLWNAAQIQMMVEGKMHQFMRMYWAKKILEWSKTPESALTTAIYLNNKYNLDGDDPNSYVGCMWAICGVHDRPWKNGRPIYGSIRYLDTKYYHHKFDTKSYIEKYQRLRSLNKYIFQDP